jgi:CubicO group peptidase (beta-lactamase class C family)
MKKLILLGVITLGFLSTIFAQIAGISSERLSRLDTFIHAEMAKGNIPGAVTLIIKNGQVVQHKALGFKDAIAKVPMEKDDLFYIQSMTKPIITVAFMMLYEEGKFLLTDPVSKYIPEFKKLRVIKNREDGIKGETDSLQSEMTISQLLSHTSGLTHGLGSDRFEREFMANYFFQLYPNIQSRVSKISNFPLYGQPGKQWRYSAGPDILSALIEKFSGLSTDEFLKTRVFRPLEMTKTFYNVPDADLNKIVKVHTKGEKIGLSANQPPKQGVKLWSGVNALYSTAKDYGNFCQMLLHGGSFNGKQLLSRKTIELMTLNHSGNMFIRPGEGFGYGFAVVTDVASTNFPGSEGLFYWEGAYNTHFFIDPRENLITVFMTQESTFNWEYHGRMRQLVYQSFMD